MKLGEEVSIAISLLALLASVFSTYLSVRTSTTLQSADYQAYQKFKADTTRLLSTFRSIIHKATLSTQGGEPLDFTTEKNYVNEFLSSTTAFAYHAWVAEKSKRATEAGKQGEAWRVFFLQLVNLSRSDTPLKMGKIAADLELLFNSLSEEDLEEIATYLSDLPTGIRKVFEGREHDPLVQAFVELYGRQPSEADSKKDLAKLHQLRKLGVNDPDVDLFVAVMTDNLELAKQARERGANLNATLGQVFSKYKEQLRQLSE